MVLRLFLLLSLILFPVHAVAEVSKRPFWTETAMSRMGDELFFVGVASCAQTAEAGREQSFARAVEELLAYAQSDSTTGLTLETQMLYEEPHATGCPTDTVSTWRLLRVPLEQIITLRDASARREGLRTAPRPPTSSVAPSSAVPRPPGSSPSPSRSSADQAPPDAYPQLIVKRKSPLPPRGATFVVYSSDAEARQYVTAWLTEAGYRVQPRANREDVEREFDFSGRPHLPVVVVDTAPIPREPVCKPDCLEFPPYFHVAIGQATMFGDTQAFLPAGPWHAMFTSHFVFPNRKQAVRVVLCHALHAVWGHGRETRINECGPLPIQHAASP